MRKRSMSVFTPRDDNCLSRKFEGVASDNDLPSESDNEIDTEIHLSDTNVNAATNDADWTKAEYQEMVAKIKEVMPKKDVRKWKTTLEALDWKQVVVGKRTADEVERVAKEVIGKTRRFRILSEMLDEVADVVNKLMSAERPKPPLTAYSLFVKEKLPHLREEHRDLKVQQIFKLIPEQFKLLSAKKRKRYENEAAKLKEDYHHRMEKFYIQHPDLSPKKGWKPRKEPLKTPFHLFYQKRREVSSNISFQQARKEWESLSVKDKVVYIQKSFEVQGNTDLKLVNKKELEMLGQSLGKPEFCGRNVYEFFRRKMKKTFSGKEHAAKISADYKNMNPQELEALKQEYQQARTAFVKQYQEYIKKLPKDKQQVELDFLMTITEKKTKVKAEKSNAATEEDPYLESPDYPPAAESTTIKKRPAKSSKVAPIKEEHKSDHSDTDSFEPSSSARKKTSKSTVTPSPAAASVASPKKRKQQTATKPKLNPPPSSDSSSDEQETVVQSPAKGKAAAATTPVTNSNGRKRTSSEEPQTMVKKSKKAQVKKEAEPSAPVEPEKPPRYDISPQRSPQNIPGDLKSVNGIQENSSNTCQQSHSKERSNWIPNTQLSTILRPSTYSWEPFCKNILPHLRH
ncbi:nucleolar transcription factor 1-like isoform X2 [Armigeres subalbatus]|uniref:nucleolar transcription factor 1-like isoform X2 n=1 Tax=Armigeres subalbatus TaxID=124917 RepID=UPI002ED54193